MMERQLMISSENSLRACVGCCVLLPPLDHTAHHSALEQFRSPFKAV